AEGRISPADPVLSADRHVPAWMAIARAVHERTSARVGLVLNHAGRRGAVRPPLTGLDRPLREGAWPLAAPSALPYTAASQIPRALDRVGMEAIRDHFARAACLATEAGTDLLQLHMGHGYLLASFLSPLSNQREDEYGGTVEQRMRFPLEVFDAVRAIWPAERPLAAALTVADCAKGGLSIDDGVAIARALRQHGCDLLTVLVGQTIPTAEPPYGRGFLTPFSDRIRNEAGIPTLVDGYLVTANEANTILAGGRADLCLLTPDQPADLEDEHGARMLAHNQVASLEAAPHHATTVAPSLPGDHSPRFASGKASRL
ncbi:MAG: bifunctional salicylyl-CoA 5-hydroxylase/oxidoreductase, partial [Chloroflexota bacterium]